MGDFKKLNVSQLKKLTIDELQKYYLYKRNHDFETQTKIKNLKLRKALYPIAFSPVLKVNRKFNGKKITIINDGRSKEKERPVIYALTHIGKFDIEMVMEAINEHAYVLMGDPEQLYRTIDGKFLELFGVQYLEIKNDNDDETMKRLKENDAYIAKETIIKILLSGGNVIWTPEGIWNISENVIINHFKFGIIEAALRGNADIVPVAIEQIGANDEEFVISIGPRLNFGSYKDQYKDEKELKIKAALELRNAMATEKWNIWESQGIVKHKHFSKSYWDDYINRRLEEWPDFTKEDLLKRVYKTPGITTKGEAFKHLEEIKYNLGSADNLFLINKKHNF